ncbi:MAG: glycine--tRNA ligase [Candidatus Pacebacteria bacterium]|nr:glycine--tRNA ligase [Candidatus Paceibacterota bacterium]
MKVSLDTLVALAKRRGFVYPGSEIYGGLAGTYDYGPMGVALKKNIEQLWWNRFVTTRDDMYGLDSSIVMPEAVWKASGHLEGFTDPMTECRNCKTRIRADQVVDAILHTPFSVEEFNTKWKDILECPNCGKKGTLQEARQFNLLFPIEMGASSGGTTTGYLRGEIAQGMFVNFKNVIDSFHPKLPFGIAQSGKAFRNEIAPREFLFRVREFDLMEFEYFIKEADWEERFEYWRKEMWAWIEEVGIEKEAVHELEVSAEDRAHYSKRTIDFEFDFPMGRKELYGLAYRTDYDLARHAEASGENLTYLDEETKEKFIPHVIEPTFGLGRTVLAVLASAYREDELGGETRVYLALAPKVAPVKAMVSPLLKNKPELVAKARDVREMLRKVHPSIAWDDNGNIGKRYRRQDEIGTPWCVTVDFDTLEDGTVTVRDRDTGEQERLSVEAVVEKLRAAL